MLFAFRSLFAFAIMNVVTKANNAMKVAIIGAGPTGLISGKYCKEAGFECDIFEQTEKVGGTWVYTDKTEIDENGLPVHSSMYQGLTTNLPKELMFFKDFPYPEELQRSYLYQPEVLEYFENFTAHFQLYQRIKFFNYVNQIQSLENEKWLVKTLNVKNKTEDENIYDAVMVCNGHFEVPFIPQKKGANIFDGFQIHSHKYRSPNNFTGKNVLLIGAGPSGKDISTLIANVASKVYLSHKSTVPVKLPESIILKPSVKQILKTSVIFEDESIAPIDIILYCTGYKYTYPFLNSNCGIEVIQDKWVRPLYKHVINIEHPTMGFIGIPFTIAVIPEFEVQVRFFIASLTGHFKIPSKEKMLDDLKEDVFCRQSKLKYPHHMHEIGDHVEQKKYFDDLTKTANITGVPNVINKLYQHVKAVKDLRMCYRIIDDENFECTSC